MTAFGASFGSSGLAVPTANYNANKDFEVASPPSDSISSLSFSPVANYLIATSWDNQVRCYEIQANGQSAGKAAISHDQPVLCSDWSADGSTVFTGQAMPQLPHCFTVRGSLVAFIRNFGHCLYLFAIRPEQLAAVQVAATMSQRCGTCRQTRPRWWRSTMRPFGISSR
jgi:WD40 repeat protein